MPVQSSLSQAAHKGKIPATGSSAPELQRSNRKTSVQEDPGIVKRVSLYVILVNDP